MASAFIVSLIVAALGLACAAQPLQRQSSGDPFSLYAYGDNVNGLEVFYADGEYRPMSEVADPLTSSTGKLRSEINRYRARPTKCQCIVCSLSQDTRRLQTKPLIPGQSLTLTRKSTLGLLMPTLRNLQGQFSGRTVTPRPPACLL